MKAISLLLFQSSISALHFPLKIARHILHWNDGRSLVPHLWNFQTATRIGFSFMMFIHFNFTLDKKYNLFRTELGPKRTIFISWQNSHWQRHPKHFNIFFCRGGCASSEMWQAIGKKRKKNLPIKCPKLTPEPDNIKHRDAICFLFLSATILYLSATEYTHGFA